MQEKQLKCIQQQATTHFSRGNGFDKAMSNSVVHRPGEFGGLGYQHLFSESNIKK
jgi:hypothetical protein